MCVDLRRARFDGAGFLHDLLWIVFQWQAFKNLPNTTQLYFNGSYIATPQNTNGVLRGSSSSNPLTAYNSISDQYLLEAGVAHALKRVRGLTLTFGPRWEGVPAMFAFRDQDGNGMEIVEQR